MLCSHCTSPAGSGAPGLCDQQRGDVPISHSPCLTLVLHQQPWGTWCGDTKLPINQISYSLTASLRPRGHSGRSLLGVCGWTPPVQHPQGRWVLLLSQGCALPVAGSWLNFGLLLKCCACQRQNWRVPLFLAPPLTLFFTRSLGQRCPEWSQVPSAPVFKLWLQPELSSVP